MGKILLVCRGMDGKYPDLNVVISFSSSGDPLVPKGLIRKCKVSIQFVSIYPNTFNKHTQ